MVRPSPRNPKPGEGGPSGCWGLLALLLLCAAWQGLGADFDPEEPSARRALARARSLIEAGQPTVAVTVYEALLAKHPDSRQLRMNLTVAHFKAEQYRKTVDLCRGMLESDPSFVPALTFLGASHFQLGEYEQAAEALGRVLEDQPSERNARLMVAESLLLLGRHREALPHFNAAAKLLDSNPRVWYGLNRVHRRLQSHDTRRLEQEYADSAFAQASRGLAQRDGGSYNLATPLLSGALARRDEIGTRAAQLIAAGLAAMHREMGDSGMAGATELLVAREAHPDCADSAAGCLYVRRAYEELTEQYPGPSGAAGLFWRSRAHAALAERAFERLAALPASAQAHELRARRLDQRGAHRLAARSWRLAAELDPSNPVLLTGLANALFEAQAYDAARIVLGQFPAVTQTPELLFLRGAANLNLHNVKDSIADLERAVDLEPTLVRARAELSRAYLLDGRPELAMPQLEAILQTDVDGSLHYRLAQAYNRAGREADATIALRRYRRLQAQAAARVAGIEQRPSIPF